MLDRWISALRSARPGGAGIDEWSLLVSRSRRMSLGIKDRQVGNPHVPLNLTESCGARYLLVWEDGRVSRGYLERRQLEGDPGEALDYALAAAYQDPDAAWVRGPAEMPDVKMHAPEVGRIAGGDTEWLSRGLDAVRRRVADRGFRTWSGSFGAGESASQIVTSSGLEASAEGTSIGWHVTVNGEIGSGFGSRSIEPHARFETRLDRLMETASQLQETAEPMSGGLHPVILHPDVVEEYALDTLLDNLSGGKVSHGEGHFRREQFGSGTPVLREDIGLRLDPLQPLKSGAYRFTAEGVPAARCSYIEAGRLVQPVLNLKYARRLGLDPTPLPLSMDTLVLEGPRPLTLDQALDAASGGALVLSVLGVHTQDGSSGDFSLSAPQALRIDSGRFAGRLRATISGNLFEILRSDGLRFVTFEGESTPGLLFPCRLEPR